MADRVVGDMCLMEDDGSTHYGEIEMVGLELDVWDDINGDWKIEEEDEDVLILRDDCCVDGGIIWLKREERRCRCDGIVSREG